MSSTSLFTCCGNAQPTLFGRGVVAARWIAPSAILVLIPKCPLCVAAYVALATGFGISFTTAAYIRYTAIAACLVSLTYLVAKFFYRIAVREA